MFGQHSIISKGAALASALLILTASSVLAAPGYVSGSFSHQHGGYSPDYYGGRHGFGGFHPGYYYPRYRYGSGGYYPGFSSYYSTYGPYPGYFAPQPPASPPPIIESSGGRSVLPEMRELEPLDPSQTGGGALVTVHVPADAQVWFDGDLTKQRGDERSYKTSPLPVGRLYHSEVRARWKEGGRVVDQTRTVPASANHRTVVDFTPPNPKTASPSIP